MKATKRLLDSVWTLHYKLSKKGDLIIYNYSRDDAEGYEKEKELPQCKVIEDGDRIVREVIICPTYKAFNQDYENGLHYTVHNPKHVFQYSQDLKTRQLKRAETMQAKYLARKKRVQAERKGGASC